MARGPLRGIVAEELIRPDGEELSEIFEVLSCGHRRPAECDEDGMHTAESRMCWQCRDGVPTGPPGEVLDHTSFTD